MYVHLKLFWKAEHLSLCRSAFRLRRWGWVLFFTGLFWLLWVFVALGRALDHVLFPGFRQREVREPVLIVAVPRSGTTLLQELLSLDHERFVHVKLLETILPSITWQRILDCLTWLDRRIGSPLSRLTTQAEKRFFKGLESTHRLRFAGPEGDEGFFIYAFVSQAILLLFPHVEELWEAGFPDALPPVQRRKLMGYYKSCLQRQLHACGPDKTLLCKATQSCGAVESLRATFPDARFITIIRDPEQSLASHLSLFHSVWRLHSPEIARDSETSQAFARLGVAWYRHLFTFGQKTDPKRYYCVDYRELTRDPLAAVERVYAHFGWTMSSVCRARLEEASRRQRKFKSAHRYALEEFGLSRSWIRQELAQILRHYSLG
jgi:hypothetical protein